jgi:hypothetical protein
VLLTGIKEWHNLWRVEACKRCGHKRRVKVTVQTRVQDGVEQPQEERWEPHCQACQYTMRSEHYATLADKFARKAWQTRRRYAERKGAILKS